MKTEPGTSPLDRTFASAKTPDNQEELQALAPFEEMSGEEENTPRGGQRRLDDDDPHGVWS